MISFTDFCADILKLKLTLGQRVLSRVCFDGIDPRDLEGDERDISHDMFGDIQTVPLSARNTIVLRCGRYSGKSTLSAAYIIYRIMVADLSKCGPGSLPAALIISTKLKTAKISLRFAFEMLKAPELSRMVVGRTSEQIIIRRWDGREIALMVAPKSKGGEAGRGYDIISVFLDESEFIPSGQGTIVRDSDIFAALAPRVWMLGGVIVLASTPWPAESITAELFDENFGRPSRALAARASTAVMRDQAPEVMQAIATERERDPSNALREFDCLPSDASGFFFEGSSIDKAVNFNISARGVKVSGGVDLAFTGDSSGLILVERQGPRLVVIHTNLLTPTKQNPLIPSRIAEMFSRECQVFRCSILSADSHEYSSAREHCSKAGISLVRGPSVTGDRDASFLYLRDLFREGLIDLPQDLKLLKQLKAVMQVNLPGGRLKALLPKSPGIGHCDLVSALVNAVWMDRKYGPLLRSNVTELPVFVKTKHTW